MRPALEPGVIHLVRADLHAPPVSLDRLHALLSLRERERVARFAALADAHRHIIGRGLARLTLGALLDEDPAALVFHVAGAGKPFLPGGPSFSIAHSGSVVLLGFARDGRLGVDVEEVRPRQNLEALARRSFVAEEFERFCRVPPGEARLRSFYRLWSRKEAVLKALGTGIAALRTFAVSEEDAPGDALIRMQPPGERAGWWVRSVPCGPAVEAAVAWDRPLREITSG